MMARQRWIGLGGLAAVVAAGALVWSAIGGAASDPVPDAFSNTSPVGVKVVYTGGTVPSTSYSVIGRLTLPVGSYAIFAKTHLYSSGPETGVECFLTTPSNAIGDFDGMVIDGSTKDTSVQNLSFTTVSSAPNGGNVDLRCRVTNKAADRTVFERGATITAVSTNSATATHNAPPALGA